jgi:translocator assembly and maintenance protein 41
MEAAKSSQLDLLLAVDSELINQWHYENLKLNPKHYVLSSIPSVAYGLATKLQSRPPGAFFHTFVEHPDYQQKIASGTDKSEIGSQYWKYGVISTNDLLEDLNTWNHLFIAGRLQKPVLDLDSSYFSYAVEKIQEGRKANLKAAAAAAMIILPQNFSELDLYYIISSLSYAGDIRLLLGAENPDKLNNMVYNRPNSLIRFRKLFDETLSHLESKDLLLRSRKPSSFGTPHGLPVHKFEQNPTMKPELLRSFLPVPVQDAILHNAHGINDLDHQMREYVFKTVRRSSSKQFVNNILMNDPLKSTKYAIAKLTKGLLRRR